jgi:hypothetical protein
MNKGMGLAGMFGAVPGWLWQDIGVVVAACVAGLLAVAVWRKARNSA